MTTPARALAAALVFSLPAVAFAAEEGEDSALPLPELSGYVQGRFVWDEQSTHDRVTDGFTVRRARLKLEWLGEHGGVVLQIDGSPRGVTLRDAEARLKMPLLGGLELSVGQMKWPFGYEVLQSSQERELPERSRAFRAFFSNERDRGARLRGKAGIVRFSGGVFDGNGIDARGFVGRDNDRYKDVVGRVGVELGAVSGGVSGWYGQTVRALEDGEAEIPATERTFDRTRLGADLQVKLTPWGDRETALKLEAVRGRTYWRDGAEQFGLPAWGGYALLTQELPWRNTIAVRYDVFDGLLGTADVAMPGDATRPERTNAVHTLGFAVVHAPHEKLKLTAAYELPMTGGPDGALDPRDNVFTLQLQASY